MYFNHIHQKQFEQLKQLQQYQQFTKLFQKDINPENLESRQEIKDKQQLLAE